MATMTKEFLSGGTGDGRGILVVKTATAGTIIHTCGATAKDEIHLYAFNTHTSDLLLTIEHGGGDPRLRLGLEAPGGAG